MDIFEATRDYEAWLGTRLRVLPYDLRLKHRAMRSAPFPFLRATYYRWAQAWEEIVGRESRAPVALAVGDLHVENFGTWRDAEGRLVWGINDFDEAWPMPYVNDLIRLAASALLAGMDCAPKAGVEAILGGYADAVEAGGRPVVLAEHHAALHTMATARLHEPGQFWDKLTALPEYGAKMPAGARKAIERMMPERGLRWRISHRIAGLGSLGRERYVAVADWRGALVARDAKALAPSACLWAAEELPALPKVREEVLLLHAMGWETANVHLGSLKPRVLAGDLKRRPGGWLLGAARKMEEAALADFEAYSTR